MQTKELKEYLGIVADMEESIYLQQNILSAIRKEIEMLKIPKKFLDPEKPTKPESPPIPLLGSEIMEIIIKSIAGGFGIWFAVTLLGMLIAQLFTGGVNNAVGYGAVIFGLVVPIFWVIHCIHIGAQHIQENSESQSTFQWALIEYEEAVEQYQEKLKENQQKRQQDEADRQAKIVFLQKQAEQAEQNLVVSENRLQIIYAKNIIFPKYRNLIMVCSLYEYICAGRCSELEGHEGAYNILETEIRLDRIISQLDLVVTNLEQIRKNQFMLYSVVQESNRRSAQIQTGLNQVASCLDGIFKSTVELNEHTADLNTFIADMKKTSALTAYHTERTQKELAYMNRMDYLSGRNDDVFFNHPPV